MLGVKVDAPDRMTLARARLSLRIGHDHAKNLLGTKSGRGKGTPILLPRQVVERLRQRLDARVDLKSLQASLGVGKAQARSLVEAGLVVRGDDGKVAVDAGEVLVDALLSRRSPMRGVPIPRACSGREPRWQTRAGQSCRGGSMPMRC